MRGLSSAKIARTAEEISWYRSKLPRVQIASGHSIAARADDIAERTPNARAS